MVLGVSSPSSRVVDLVLVATPALDHLVLSLKNSRREHCTQGDHDETGSSADK